MHAQEEVLKQVSFTKASLLESESIIPTVRRCEASEVTASEQVAESKRILQSFDQQVQIYKPLADYVSVIFSVAQRLASTFKYFAVSLGQVEQLLKSLITIDKDHKVANNLMTVGGRVLHLKHQLLISVISNLRIKTFTRHQRLLPLLVSLEILQKEGKLSQEECHLLIKDGEYFEPQLDMLLNKGGSGPVIEKPLWIADKAIYVA